MAKWTDTHDRAIESILSGAEAPYQQGLAIAIDAANASEYGSLSGWYETLDDSQARKFEERIGILTVKPGREKFIQQGSNRDNPVVVDDNGKVLANDLSSQLKNRSKLSSNFDIKHDSPLSESSNREAIKTVLRDIGGGEEAANQFSDIVGKWEKNESIGFGVNALSAAMTVGSLGATGAALGSGAASFSLGGAAGGAAKGAIKGGILSGILSESTGGDFLKGAARGAAGGAISGAIGGAFETAPQTFGERATGAAGVFDRLGPAQALQSGLASVKGIGAINDNSLDVGDTKNAARSLTFFGEAQQSPEPARELTFFSGAPVSQEAAPQQLKFFGAA